MKKRFLAAAIAVVTLVMSAAAGGALADSDARPFKGSVIDGTFVGAPPPEASVGDVVATYIGKGSMHLDLPGAPAPVGPTITCPFLLRMTADANGVITAANGDEIQVTARAEWDGGHGWTMCPQPDGTMVGNAVYEVTGGTGRFDDATGVIHNAFVVTMSEPGPFGFPVSHTGELSGWIGY